MNWILVAVFVALTHLLAAILGRTTSDRIQRLAFASGLLGLLSFPAVLYFGIKSLCIAGACRGLDTSWLDVSLAVFGLLAATSLGSSAVLLLRRRRA